MNNVHGAHGTTRIVEDPLLIQVHISARQLLTQLVDNEPNHGTGIIAMSANGTLSQIMEILWVENVEPLQM